MYIYIWYTNIIYGLDPDFSLWPVGYDFHGFNEKTWHTMEQERKGLVLQRSNNLWKAWPKHPQMNFELLAK
jgi:hypothetical protein